MRKPTPRRNLCCAGLLFLFGAFGPVADAQVPTITSVTFDTSATDNTSFRVFVNTAQASWIAVQYGTSSGTYPYNTKSLEGTAVSLTVAGLTPGTTYYVLATARPDSGDNNNLCATPACGAVEQTITTGTNQQLEPPALPAAWNPSHPDTSAYTIIPIGVPGGAMGECVALQAVSSPDGWSVNSGDTITTILNEIGYGSVLEFAQGSTCVVPYQSTYNYMGYILPYKGLDPQAGGNINSPAHRYIVFRTKSVSSADFPPFGVRVTPAWSSKMAKLYMQQPTPRQVGAGQVFDAEQGTPGVHHFWFETLEMTPSPAYTNPTDAVDPTAFTYFFRVGSQYQNTNNAYLVLDRLYMHGGQPPLRQGQALEIGGNYQAVVNCYISQVQTWRLTAWPLYTGTLNSNGSVMTMPANNYRFQASTPMLGMTGPATATLSTTGNYSGSVVGNLYKDHFEIQYATSTSGSASIACSGCTAVQTPGPGTPGNALQLFSGQISNGGFNGLSWNTNCETCTSGYVMAAGIQFTDPRGEGGPYVFDNNYMDGVGEGFYVDALYSNYANDDVTYTHNHNIWPKNYFTGDPNWVGWRFDVRQHFEMKRGHRYNLTGNVFSYSWSFQNDDPAIFVSGRPQYLPESLSSGITDVTIRSNIIRHGREGVNCMGISPSDNGLGDLDPQITSRVSITNNLMYDLGRSLYCDYISCPGFQSPYFVIRPGCQNVTIRNNTGGIMKGDMPVWFYIGGGTALGSLLDFEDNILYLSAGASTGSPNVYWGGVVGDWPLTGYTGHEVTPGASYSIDFDPTFTTVPNFKGFMDETFVNIGASVTQGAYTWKNNLVVGGYGGAYGMSTDLTQAQVQSMAAKMPPGDTYIPGNTIAAREAAIGFANPAAWNYQILTPNAYTAGGQGVDYTQLYSDAGYVTGVQPLLLMPGAVQFVYTAPDSKTCSVDVSPDGVNWSRSTDSGGLRARTLVVSGLTARAVYQYRILCYFEQVNDGVLYTEYTPDQITDGSFTTLSNGVGRIFLQFRASAVPNASTVGVVLQPVSGAPITQTCTNSPCGFSAPVGDYAMTLTYYDATGKSLSRGRPLTVSVRE